MLHKHYTELLLNYGVLVSLPIGGGSGAAVKIT
jgi:hypothetical protein